MLSSEPKDPNVLNFVRQVLYKGEGDQLIAMGIRHLSSIGDSWVSNQFKKFLSYPSLKVKVAVVESLHFSCPKNRDELLKIAENENIDLITEKVKKERKLIRVNCR